LANLLVTGGAGFIGGNFMHYWRARYPADTLVVLDALTYAGNRATIADVPGIELVVGTICDTRRRAAAQPQHRHAGPLRRRKPC